MNNFTKEELEEIMTAMNYWHEDLKTSLHNKIQSMIDNYCDHEDYRKDEWMICVCNKCHKVFDNDNQ